MPAQGRGTAPSGGEGRASLAPPRRWAGTSPASRPRSAPPPPHAPRRGHGRQRRAAPAAAGRRWRPWAACPPRAWRRPAG
eukprot:989888-Pyramimonas_sp.AAC.1